MTGVIPRSLIAADRRHHTCLRDAREHCRPLPPSTGQKKLRVLNPILRLYRIQPTGKSFRMRVEMGWELVWGDCPCLFRNDANLNNAHPSRAPAAPAAPPHAAAPPLSRIPA